jgi:hypothetical protein
MLKKVDELALSNQASKGTHGGHGGLAGRFKHFPRHRLGEPGVFVQVCW